MRTITFLDVAVECPRHEGNFDCTPFCGICEGEQEVSMDSLLEQADTVAFDGCHKIYLNMDKQQTDKMIGYGYTDMVGGSFLDKKEAVYGWYEESCPLRFVDAFFTKSDGTDEFLVIVGQDFS